MSMPRLVIYLFSLLLTLGGWAARAAGDTKAAELLAQARAAIGGDKQIARVSGLSCAGTLQRMLGDRSVTGEITIDMQLPDKILRTDSINPMGDVTVVTEQGINGDKLLRNSKTLNTPPGAVIRLPPPPAPGSDAEAQQLRGSRAEFARFALAMILSSPPTLPVEFTYAGEAESSDGKADVLDVKGASSFAAKLFLDKSSHRPLMLQYRGIAPRMVVQTQRGDGPGNDGRAGRGNGRGDEGRGHAEPQAPAAPEQVDIQMFFDDYKQVDGLSLPHHITRSVDGKPNEEWTFKTIKVNPAFKPDTFSGK